MGIKTTTRRFHSKMHNTVYLIHGNIPGNKSILIGTLKTFSTGLESKNWYGLGLGLGLVRPSWKCSCPIEV